ncbi:uncharacterized protein LOC133260340 isoform X2 [Bos javanicus]|uniref:uncharacterized protein LOC133260340 isoform X2 n=1 Tax=Bos javanicus TaxID=9906 RepID=UPI002AA6CA77|nr:uncharacterized protein LOC133260340 isoform X2 [Bos javanicus]
MARGRKEGKKGLGVFQFPGEAAGVRALNATAFQVEAKATSSGLRRIQLTPSFLVTPTGPFPSPLPPLREIDSRVEEAFPGTAFLMAQLRMDWIASSHVRKPFDLAWTPAAPHPLNTPHCRGPPYHPFLATLKVAHLLCNGTVEIIPLDERSIPFQKENRFLFFSTHGTK